jgi:hypothetical protein
VRNVETYRTRDPDLGLGHQAPWILATTLAPGAGHLDQLGSNTGALPDIRDSRRQHSGDYRGSRSISVRYEGKGRFIRLERWIHEVQWSAVPMCNPTRLIALPPARKPHGLIAPFTRPYWIPVPVKDYEVMAVKHYEVNEAMTIENREIRENQYPDLFSPQSNLSSSTQTEADMAVLKVPDQDWNTLAEIGRRPEHLRTAPQMANYVIRRGVLEEQMKFGRQLREEPK